MSKRELRSADSAPPVGTYSQGLVVGDFVYTSGMGPLDPKTGEIVGSWTRPSPPWWRICAAPTPRGSSPAASRPSRSAPPTTAPGP
ncbi:hypothetical protein AB0C21_08615 [Spirillospora sp. NPDC049024]